MLPSLPPRQYSPVCPPLPPIADDGNTIDDEKRRLMMAMAGVNEVSDEDQMTETMAANETNNQCLSSKEMDSAQIDLVDTTNHFRTDMVFESKDCVLDWTKRTGRVNGVVVVVLRSDLNDPKRKPRVILGCERSGTYKSRDFVSKSSSSSRSNRRASTKKCGCPFRLRAQATDSSMNQWGLYVMNGTHNHILARAAEGLSYLGRLTRNEVELVEKLCKTGVKSREMLHQIKLADPTNASTLKTIYNVRNQLRINEMASRSYMQQLFKQLTELGYVTRYRSEPETNVVQDLFWAYSPSIQLARAFPFVFMLDCTYKMNKYRLSSLEIVGVTSTDKTFAVAFCYMSSEKKDNYEWCLECFKDLFNGTTTPNVFITYKELALMNAIKSIFPNVQNLLCRVHVERNVLAKCVKLFQEKADFDEFVQQWTYVIHSLSIEEFEKNMNSLTKNYKHQPHALSYLSNSWLRDYKQHFVSAWINKFLHFGNTTTNRMEGSHAKLKKHLSISVHGFESSFNAVHLLLEGQLTEIKASFEDSLTRVPLRFRKPIYKQLVGVVSTACLEKIEAELEVAEKSGMDMDCNHVTLHTLGLPCAHMLMSYKMEGREIPLIDIHAFWKNLTFRPYTGDKMPVTIDAEMDMIYTTFLKATLAQKLKMKRQLNILAKASTTPLLKPILKVNLRGRKNRRKSSTQGKECKVEQSTKRESSAFEHALEKHIFEDVSSTQRSVNSVTYRPKLHVHRTKSVKTTNWITSFPEFIQPFITNVVDVVGDGHCGYRVVAGYFGLDNDGWRKVREDLSQELRKHRNDYNKILSPLISVEELVASIDCQDQFADVKYWMNMPTMGIVIASCYMIPVVHISSVQCLTFFPLRDPMSFEDNQRILIFGFINGSHFVRLELVNDSPLPPVSKMWSDHHSIKARHWMTIYAYRIEKFKNFIASQNI